MEDLQRIDGRMKKKKLKLVYIPYTGASCIPHPHYDLCTDEKNPENIACILTDKEGAKLIRKALCNEKS